MSNSLIPFYKQLDKFIITSQGCFLFDEQNNKYLDFESGDWAANLGHASSQITEVISRQAELLIHDGLHFRNRQSEELSIKLLDKLSFKNGKSTFLNSGSEAVNLGITLAKNLTGRSKILKMDCSYLSALGHGQSNNKEIINIGFDKIEKIGNIHFEEIAVFVFEPGNSGGLVRFPSNEFIKAVSEIVKKYGGLLMANEVTTGFGRTGKWFGYQYYDFVPDIVSMGKALGNGYPVSCVSVSENVASMFDKAPFRYAQSHQNDPLGCAVGLEVIKIMEETGLVERSLQSGQYFIERLNKLKADFPDKVKEIRGRGLMIAIEFYDNVNKENLYLQLIEEGFLVGFRENVLRFMPPLIIEQGNIDSLIYTLHKLLMQ